MEKVRYYYSQPLYQALVVLRSNHRGEFDPEKIIAYSKESMREVPRITVCAVLDTETNMMSFGYARCNPNDNFCRAIGREISYKRAKEDPVFVKQAPKTNIGVWRTTICRIIENTLTGVSYDDGDQI